MENSSRIIAIRAIHQWRKKKIFLEESLEKEFSKNSLSHQERSFIYEIAFGTVRNWETLRYYATHILLITLPKDELKISILFSSLYQRIFHSIEKSPHALVYEYVNVAKKLLSSQDPFIGFINALLRKSLLVPYNKSIILADTTKDAFQKMAVEYSMSEFFISKIREEQNPIATQSILEALQKKPPLYARGNFSPAAGQFEIQKIDSSHKTIRREERISSSSEIYIQNITQAKLVEKALFHILPKLAQRGRPISLLDLCASPGGKAIMFWQALTSSDISIGNMVLNEPQLLRHRRLEENKDRFSIPATLTSYDGRAFPPSSFDIILVDAPCSNSGVFFKCPEARYRLNRESLFQHSKLQKELLLRSAELLAPSGFLVYMTCSILSDENEKCIETVVKNKKALHFIDSHLILPQEEGYEGGFMGLLQKIE